MQGAWVQSLNGKLESHILCGVAKKKKKTNGMTQPLASLLTPVSHCHCSTADLIADLRSMVGKSQAGTPRSKTLRTLSRARQRPSQQSYVVWGWAASHKGPKGV